MSPSYEVYGKCFINGAFLEETEKTFTLRNPATGKVAVQNVQEAGANDVDTAVKFAEAAFDQWSETAHARVQSLRKLADLITENAKVLAELDSVSMGKPVAFGIRDAMYGAACIRHAAALAESYVGGTATTNAPGRFDFSLKQPYGVVAAICPWNVPMSMFGMKAGPALAAGNCIILKSSEKSPLSASFAASLGAQAGIPPGVLQVVTGAGLTGKLLAEHMRIRKVSFTGSGRTGRAVQQSAAQSNLKDVSLELGGKSPSIVFDDADLEQAAKALSFSLWFNSGQICISTTRVYVQENVANQFLEKYKHFLRSIQAGDPGEGSTTFGPLADDTQFNLVKSYIESGRGSGSVVLDGLTEGGKPNVITPTVFTGVSDDAKINVEEIFGPVAIVHTFKDAAEAIRLSNNTEYGLFASVFTENINKAITVAKKLDSGSVGINCTSPIGSADMEFGGWKQSGIGREGGPRNLDNWLQSKAVYVATPGF